jgi:hypothetical protein
MNRTNMHRRGGLTLRSSVGPFRRSQNRQLMRGGRT